jgi:hypothetical protein
MKKTLATLLLLTTTFTACDKYEVPRNIIEDEEWIAFDKKWVFGTYQISSHSAEYFDANGRITYPGYLQYRMDSDTCWGTIRITADSFFITEASESIYRALPKQGKWGHLHPHSSPFVMYMDSFDNDGNDESIPGDTTQTISQGWEALVANNGILLFLNTTNTKSLAPDKTPYITFKQVIALNR